jgi:hypothetical protein
MKKLRILLLAALIGVLFVCPANAYQVYLSSFDAGLGSTGRIFGNDGPTLNSGTPFPYVFCIDEITNVIVPGSYYAQNVTLTNSELQAAWLMKNYGNTTYPGLTYVQTGIVVQNAIWSATGQKMHVTDDYLSIANAMVSAASTADLSGLASSYARMNLFTDAGLTNHVQDQIRPIPIPAAVWLLGTGLVGLIGIRRRFTS